MKNRPHPLQDPAWQQTVGNFRFRATTVINEIRRGSVDEDDLDRLHNFMLQALALIEVSGPDAWERAKQRAEFLSRYHDNDPTLRGVYNGKDD